MQHVTLHETESVRLQADLLDRRLCFSLQFGKIERVLAAVCVDAVVDFAEVLDLRQVKDDVSDSVLEVLDLGDDLLVVDRSESRFDLHDAVVASDDRHFFLGVAELHLVFFRLAHGAFSVKSLVVLLAPLLLLLELLRLFFEFLGFVLLVQLVLLLKLDDPVFLIDFELLHHVCLLMLRQELDVLGSHTHLF